MQLQAPITGNCVPQICDVMVVEELAGTLVDPDDRRSTVPRQQMVWYYVTGGYSNSSTCSFQLLTVVSHVVVADRIASSSDSLHIKIADTCRIVLYTVRV